MSAVKVPNMQESGGYMSSRMRLYDDRNQRLYINRQERERFLAVARKSELPLRAFCLTLVFTGCRLSEALALTVGSVDVESRFVSIRTLKKRCRHEVREVPIPVELAAALSLLCDRRIAENPEVAVDGVSLWTSHHQAVDRITGYRWIKSVMKESGIQGMQASPKGLRHGYGVHALRSGVQLNMLRKWMGHASMATTAIYANAVGRDELEIAERMW